jgi:Spy/CpxP family protein refolding chaperone
MKKFITAVALTVSLVPTAFAQDAAPPGRGHFRGRGMIAAFAKLDLTVEQKQQIRAIRQADAQQNRPLYASFRAKVAEYRQLEQANDPNAAAAKAALEPLAQQVKVARKATRDQVLNVLTPEQRGQLQSFAAQRQVRSTTWKSLNLTVDQKQQIKAIRQADRQQNQALYQSLRTTVAQYRQLQRANDPNAASVKTDLQALRGQVRTARAATQERVLGVLTPEQRSQLEQLRGKH